jgi:hypothetical protein
LYASLVGFANPKDIVVSTTARYEGYRDVVNTCIGRPRAKAKSFMNVRPEIAEILQLWVRKAEHDTEAARRIIAVEEDCRSTRFFSTASRC